LRLTEDLLVEVKSRWLDSARFNAS